MILKISFYEEEVKQNPNCRHMRILDVYDFHIGKPEDNNEQCSHEIVYHTVNGKTGHCLVGKDKKNADHVYVMENGKTVDHMQFYAN
jgi:hypothetical protein